MPATMSSGRKRLDQPSLLNGSPEAGGMVEGEVERWADLASHVEASLSSRQAIVPSLTDGSTGVGMRFATRPSGYPPSLWLFVWTMAGTVATRLDL